MLSTHSGPRFAVLYIFLSCHHFLRVRFSTLPDALTCSARLAACPPIFPFAPLPANRQVSALPLARFSLLVAWFSSLAWLTPSWPVLFMFCLSSPSYRRIRFCPQFPSICCFVFQFTNPQSPVDHSIVSIGLPPRDQEPSSKPGKDEKHQTEQNTRKNADKRSRHERESHWNGIVPNSAGTSLEPKNARRQREQPSNQQQTAADSTRK